MLQAAQHDPRVGSAEDRTVLLQLLLDHPGNVVMWEPDVNDIAEACLMTPGRVERSLDNLVSAGVASRFEEAGRSGLRLDLEFNE